ncbi:hypothetical protein [Amycolatopsis sp. NPDC001319]|uniref:hypothetical protein n=1 Tax=unclassified Amycolatopsis TaxID=2618356 RepID=UPI003676CC87
MASNPTSHPAENPRAAVLQALVDFGPTTYPAPASGRERSVRFGKNVTAAEIGWQRLVDTRSAWADPILAEVFNA